MRIPNSDIWRFSQRTRRKMVCIAFQLFDFSDILRLQKRIDWMVSQFIFIVLSIMKKTRAKRGCVIISRRYIRKLHPFLRRDLIKEKFYCLIPAEGKYFAKAKDEEFNRVEEIKKHKSTEPLKRFWNKQPESVGRSEKRQRSNKIENVINQFE